MKLGLFNGTRHPPSVSSRRSITLYNTCLLFVVISIYHSLNTRSVSGQYGMHFAAIAKWRRPEVVGALVAVTAVANANLSFVPSKL